VPAVGQGLILMRSALFILPWRMARDGGYRHGASAMTKKPGRAGSAGSPPVWNMRWISLVSEVRVRTRISKMRAFCGEIFPVVVGLGNNGW